MIKREISFKKTGTLPHGQIKRSSTPDGWKVEDYRRLTDKIFLDHHCDLISPPSNILVSRNSHRFVIIAVTISISLIDGIQDSSGEASSK